jgi:hypothetical protein
MSITCITCIFLQSEEDEPERKRRRRVEDPNARSNNNKRSAGKVYPILNKRSNIIYPVLDKELETDIQQKNLKEDYSLRQRLLPKMLQAYNATLGSHPDNVLDYKYFMKKVVKEMLPLLSAQYTNPYVCIGVGMYMFHEIILFLHFPEGGVG